MSRFSNLKSFIYAEDQKSSAFVDSKDTNAQVTENAVSEDSVVQKVGMPTDSSIKEMSEFDDIAVSEQPERIDVMELSDVAPLKLDVIVDSTGFLSDKVDKFIAEKNVAVVPFSAVGILKQVSQLQRHDILELGDTKYAMLRTARSDVLEYYRKVIIDSITAGLVFSEKLTVSIVNGTETIRTLKLSKIEWSYLCAWFRDYNARIEEDNNDIRLVVG